QRVYIVELDARATRRSTLVLAVKLSEHGDLDSACSRVNRVSVQVERPLICAIQNSDAHNRVALLHDIPYGTLHLAPEHILLGSYGFRVVLRSDRSRHEERGGDERAAKLVPESEADHSVEVATQNPT